MMTIIQWKTNISRYSRGFSLVEVLVALALFSFGLTALISTHQVATYTLQSARERYNALLIAQEYLEQCIMFDNSTVQENPVFRNGINYFITWNINKNKSGVQNISINVQWKKKQLSLSTTHFVP